jgi:hypothetical protein
MKPCVLAILCILFTFQSRAADYYWVGGAGNWSDLNHWRLGSSSGAIPSIVPSSGDNVFFDAGSGFTAVSKTVTLNANGFCNNMTWSNVPNSPLFVASSSTFTVQLSGSLSLSPTTTYQAIFAFKGATPATITTNGTVLGQFGMEIDKPGSSLTVTDSLIVPSAVTTAGTNGLTFTAGTFDITGKKVKVYNFISDNNNVRTLQMANADVTANSGSNSGFSYTGANKTLNAAGSTLLTFGYRVDGGTYNKVIGTSGTGPNAYIINNTTFSSLTFLPAVPGSNDIGSNNTIDTLIFNGTGAIGSNNTIGRASFGLAGSIIGTGNVIRSLTCLNNFDVTGNFTNTVDSLVLAPYRITQFRGTFNINKYLYAAGVPCEAFTEINGDSTLGTVNFASGAVADLSNVVLTGVKATGPITPIAVNGVNGGGNSGFTITEPAGTGTTLYWVGGSGDWNDRSHWSTGSGVAGGACIPFKTDNVVFDANSGLATGTVTTSSSSFCKDMTWTGVGTVTFNESGTSAFSIYGSLVMDNSVTMNAIFGLVGANPASITTNGSTLGGLQFLVLKTGGAVATLTDDWNNPNGGSFIHMSGGLNLSGRTVNLVYYSSNYNSTRSLDISNATLSFRDYWDYRNVGKTLNAAGSHLTSNGGFGTDGLSYPWVDIPGISGTGIGYPISGTTFGQMTWTNTSVTSAVFLSANNIVRRLEFKSNGSVGPNCIIDSLILTGSRVYGFGTNVTINKYLKAQATSCSGLTEIRGPGSIAFASGAVVEMDNVYMQNMTATGPITPIAFNGADAGGNTGWTITSAPGAARYWVNGAGDWSDNSHWSSTSGGAGGTACIPTVYDDVYFDAGSGFTSASKTVTINNGNAYARNMNWTGAANSPIFNKSNSFKLEVWGDSLILNPATTLNTTYLRVMGSNTTYMKGSVPAGNFNVQISKTGSGGLTVLTDYSNPNTVFYVETGAFNAPGRVLNAYAIDNNGVGNATSMDISNATVTTDFWRYSGTPTNHALNAANSSITTARFHNDGKVYNKVSISGTLVTDAVIRTTTIDSLIFTNPSTTSAVGIANNNLINYLEYKGSGVITGTGNIIDTLVFFPGSTYTLTAGTNTTITGEWFGSGTPCRPTEIVSSSTTANATVTKNTGTVSFDYVRLRRITAAGTAQPFIAYEHTNDLGSNVNWNIAPYNGATPILGLGPDVLVYASEFPYTIKTDGFFASPSSTYLWSDGSTADTLAVSGPGTYGVSVSLADGCNINDQIVVNLNTLPVTLTSFTATAVDCQAKLQWKVEDALDFSHFIMEQSRDGSLYTAIGQVPYTNGIGSYNFIDNNPGSGTTWYRLKMVDIDRKYKYSSVASIRSDCTNRQIVVRPTVTSNTIQVMLPQGYEKAQLNILNTSGQRMAPVVKGNGVLRTVSLQGLPAAVYILQVINGSDSKTFMVIKQ